jgi:hypothetical protein
MAQAYPISRTFLDQRMGAAHGPLATLWRAHKPPVQDAPRLLAPCSVLWRLAGQGSLPSLSSILPSCPYHPHAVGSLRACVQHSGAALPSTLAMAARTGGFALSEEIVARPQPLVGTLEAQSTALRNMPWASERSAETWHAPVDDRGAQRVHSLGMAADRGLGLVAGSHAAGQDARGGWERLPALHDLLDRRRPLERQASAALAKEDEAAPMCHHAPRAAHRHQRLPP